MNRMAGGTNGLDLSGTNIIVDSIAITTSPFMQNVPFVRSRYRLNARQDCIPGC